MSITIERSPDFNLIRQWFDQVLRWLKININDDNYKDTAKRMAETYIDLCSWLYSFSEHNIIDEFEKVFPTKYQWVIIQKPIKAYSLCSHHLLPIFYTVYFWYIPDKKTLWFSKSIKLIQHLASKPLSQEDFTQEIVESFDKLLKPKWCIVYVEWIHLCMKIRSLKTDSWNTTMSYTWIFLDQQYQRSEFMNIVTNPTFSL